MLKKSELDKITNIVLLLTCFSIASVWGWRQFGHLLTDFRVGQVVAFDGLVKGEPALVLGLSTKCGFCVAGAPTYRKLAASHRLKILAVFHQPREEGVSFLTKYDIPVDRVVYMPPMASRIVDTPTVMILDDKHQITHLWKGGLSPDDEKQLFALLN